METELATGGYPSSPITYTVTKVNDKLQAIEKSIDVIGDKNSHAELQDVKAGKYLIEQKVIPEGYIKDTRQIIDITRDESGYALFIIDKEQVEEFEKTKVTINKQIVNRNGETATEEDFEEAEIERKDKYSFEVKIENINTKEVYYSFIDNQNADTIVGLPYGTYEIEEIYKPKFKMLEITGERLTKDEETGKYMFTLSEDNEEIQNNIIINIKNQIDTEFGFGGQDSKDNLSKLTIENIEELVITKTKIYIRDDKNNRISDATFKIYDLNGNIVKFAGANGTYFKAEEGLETITPTDGAITLKGLTKGEYKIVNESVNESFLKSRDRKITVYENAVGIRRIELLRNIPRGSLRLSTVYTDELGEKHYTPRSKYKILDLATGDTLKFERRADGTYERSNLNNATDTIRLNAGEITVENIEAGNYEVGLVDLTEKYGIIKEETEKVKIKQNETVYQEVAVKKRGGFKKVISMTSGFSFALTEDGELYCWSETTGTYEMQKYSRYASNLKDVKIKDIFANNRDR